MTLPEKYQMILNKFIEKYKKDKNVVGIFLTGSFVHSKPDKNSDLDVYILLKDSKFRERGNTWISGVEIEYFINPIKQVESYFKEEKEKHTAHMFANSMILYEKGDYLKVLIKKAIKILFTKDKKMSKFQIENAKYHIDDMEKDLEDVYKKKDWFSFELISGHLFEELVNSFFKIKGIRQEKIKRLFVYLSSLDKNFSKLLNSALLEKDYDKKYSAIKKLIRYVESILGGKRKRDWKLRGKCTYLGKKK